MLQAAGRGDICQSSMLGFGLRRDQHPWQGGLVTWVSLWQSPGGGRLRALGGPSGEAELSSCPISSCSCFSSFSWKLLGTEILSYKIEVIDVVIYNAEGSPVRFNFVSCFFVCRLFWASVPHLVLGR